MKKSTFFGMAGAAAGLFTSLSQANATINLILNPTFNPGFTDWVVTGASATVVPSSGPGFSNAAEFGNTVDTLSQAVPTISGDSYEVSFYFKITDTSESPNNSFDVTFGGQTLASATDSLFPNYAQLLTTITASGPSSTLDFTGTNAAGNILVSNVVVSDNGVVPEPSTVIALSAASLGLTGMVLCRRKQKFLVD